MQPRFAAVPSCVLWLCVGCAAPRSPPRPTPFTTGHREIVFPSTTDPPFTGQSGEVATVRCRFQVRITSSEGGDGNRLPPSVVRINRKSREWKCFSRPPGLDVAGKQWNIARFCFVRLVPWYVVFLKRILSKFSLRSKWRESRWDRANGYREFRSARSSDSTLREQSF